MNNYISKVYYLDELHDAGFVSREFVDEDEKNNENVYKNYSRTDTDYSGRPIEKVVYAKYGKCELNDYELNNFLLIRQFKLLKKISTILSFFFVASIISIIFMLLQYFN